MINYMFQSVKRLLRRSGEGDIPQTDNPLGVPIDIESASRPLETSRPAVRAEQAHTPGKSNIPADSLSTMSVTKRKANDQPPVNSGKRRRVSGGEMEVAAPIDHGHDEFQLDKSADVPEEEWTTPVAIRGKHRVNGSAEDSKATEAHINPVRADKKRKVERVIKTQSTISPKKKQASDGLEVAPVVKAVHKRFGSEDPSAPASVIPQGSTPRTAEIKDSEDDESEDDAPEEVTAEQGQLSARLKASEATKAAARIAEQEREKRRSRDKRLQDQARETKERKAVHTTDAKSDVDDAKGAERKEFESEKSRIKAMLNGTIPLPDLLPEDILMDDPEERIPESLILQTRPRKQKFKAPESKPTKDVRKGSKLVRVLESNKFVLPPRSSKSSQNLREQWMARSKSGKGRPGRRVA